MAPYVKDNLMHEVVVIEKTRNSEQDQDEDETQCECNEVSYGTGDAVFSSFVVTPQVVSVWRGIWGIMELKPDMFPYAQIFLLGIIVHILFVLIRSQLLARAQSPARAGRVVRAGRWLAERALSRLYSYVFILSCVLHWRGGFGLLDAIVAAITPDIDDPYRPIVFGAFTIFFYLTLSTLRSSRNLLASPYTLVTDGKEATYFFTTRFQSKSSKETALYILDCVFSVTVVGSLVVFVWRGSWALLDIFLYPDNKIKSFYTSLAVGYALVLLTFATQAPMRMAAARLQGAGRLLLADAYHLVSFVATVNVWRGIWGLLDAYLFPDSPKLSNWCSHFVSLALLILLNCSNSIIVRGVYIDAEEPEGDCVVFPCHYLRFYFHKEKVKKRHKNALTAAAAIRRTEEASVPLQTPEEKV